MRVNDLDEGEIHDDLFLCHPILQKFSDVFPREILGMPPKCDIDF